MSKKCQDAVKRSLRLYRIAVAVLLGLLIGGIIGAWRVSGGPVPVPMIWIWSHIPPIDWQAAMLVAAIVYGLLGRGGAWIRRRGGSIWLALPPLTGCVILAVLLWWPILEIRWFWALWCAGVSSPWWPRGWVLGWRFLLGLSDSTGIQHDTQASVDH